VVDELNVGLNVPALTLKADKVASVEAAAKVKATLYVLVVVPSWAVTVTVLVPGNELALLTDVVAWLSFTVAVNVGTVVVP
jgi:hypothetical protein